MGSDDESPVLVIGGTGFVGRRVVAKLLTDRVPVRCLARKPARASDFRTSPASRRPACGTP